MGKAFGKGKTLNSVDKKDSSEDGHTCRPLVGVCVKERDWCLRCSLWRIHTTNRSASRLFTCCEVHEWSGCNKGFTRQNRRADDTVEQLLKICRLFLVLSRKTIRWDIQTTRWKNRRFNAFFLLCNGQAYIIGTRNLSTLWEENFVYPRCWLIAYPVSDPKDLPL